MPVSKNSQVITSLLDWETHAGPKSTGHWVDDRSAKEVARAWLASGDALPPEVADALTRHPRFGAVGKWEAEPEAKLRFDDFPGEPRNSDLAVHAHDAAGAYLIAIEAKADESYGATVAETIQAAEARLKVNPRSNGLKRVHQLARRLFNDELTSTSKVLGLRYQLLTATAGALAEAERQGYARVVLLVQEFVTKRTADENHDRNTQDLLNFMNALKANAASTLVSGQLYGPFAALGGEHLKVQAELYIGKVTRSVRPSEA